MVTLLKHAKDGCTMMIRNNFNILTRAREDAEEECFLSPEAVLVVCCFLNKFSVQKTVKYLMSVLGGEEGVVADKVYSLLEKLQDYIQCAPCEEEHAEFSDGQYNCNLDIRQLSCNPHPYGSVKRSLVPKKIVFNITDYCPRECIFCFNGAKCITKHKAVNSFLTLSRFEEVLQEAKKIGVKTIEMGGGDPFVCKDIVEYLTICDKYYPGAWGTSTKAYVPKAVAAHLAQLSTVDIQISLDAFDEKIADTLMGVPGSYRQVLKSFQNLLAEGIRPSAKMVITSLNCHLVKESFYKFAEMGIRTIRANTYMMSPNRHSDALYPTDTQIAQFNSEVGEILEFAHANGITTDISEIKVPTVAGGQGIDNRVLCGASSTDMYIRYDGMMIFCGQINNCEELTIGSLKEHGIMELWHSKKIDSLYRPSYWKEKFKNTKCASCAEYNECYPKRCYVRSYAVYGSFFEVDPSCPYGKEGYINRG